MVSPTPSGRISKLSPSCRQLQLLRRHMCQQTKTFTMEPTALRLLRRQQREAQGLCPKRLCIPQGWCLRPRSRAHLHPEAARFLPGSCSLVVSTGDGVDTTPMTPGRSLSQGAALTVIHGWARVPEVSSQCYQRRKALATAGRHTA